MIKKKIKYKRNFLTKVILRFDFEQTQFDQLQEFLKESDFKKEFPLIKKEKGAEGRIGFDFKTKKIDQSSNQVTIWAGYNQKKEKEIKIHPRFIFIQYKKYNDSEELLNDAKIISNIIKNSNIKTIKRLGLRYVNEIRLKNKDFLNWDNYINKNLLGSLKFATSNNKILAQAISTITLKEEESNISFNYGVWNPNYPSQINEKIFILDFDSSSKYPIDVKDNFLNIIKKYNHDIEKLFEKTIKKDLKDLLKK